MSKLYSELSEIYEKMYATFIDYQEEYNYYSKILRKYNKKSVLEIGSGTGNLSKLFSDRDFEYIGLDLSADMLELARKKHPTCTFLEGDMRNFELTNPIESAIITGRSISYLLKNEDVNSAFKSVHKNLEPGGIFCFDIIDANRFIPQVINEEKIIHKASFDNETYIRESTWRLNMEYGMDLVWTSRYCKALQGGLKEIGTDKEIARSFTKNEIELFLEINHFEVLEILDRASYFFPTFVFVAQKKDN